mmetsp:Transcript_75523/g.133398  ORF Transcript_75523/g.133398 Transcript_75523/m.133398 type:complete len:123 (+) Transcript_75523:1459-1827(+)
MAPPQKASTMLRQQLTYGTQKINNTQSGMNLHHHQCPTPKAMHTPSTKPVNDKIPCSSSDGHDRHGLKRVMYVRQGAAIAVMQSVLPMSATAVSKDTTREIIHNTAASTRRPDPVSTAVKAL